MRTPNEQQTSTFTVSTSSEDVLIVHDLGGEGPDVLFVHATGFHGLVWEPIAHLLSGHVHGWALDLGGHGDSTVPEPITWHGFGQEVLAVADRLPRPLIAVGHSLGGAAVTLAEMARPGTLARVLLYEPAFPDDVARANLPTYLRATERRRVSFESFDRAIDNFAAKQPTSDMAEPVLRAYVSHGFRPEADGSVTLKCSPAVEAHIYACPDAFEILDDLHPLECETTLIGGVLSAPHHRHTLVHASRRLEAAVLEMPGAGHFGPLQAPDTFAALMRSLLAGG